MPRGPARERPSAGVWLQAIRPATLPAAASGVVVGLGAALAVATPFRVDAAVLCLAVALLLQAAANLANDLSDFRRGADQPDRVGPLRVAAAGLVSGRQLEVAIAVVLGVAALAGLALAVIGGPAVLVTGAAAIVALLAYTGGPWPYGYHALGEPFVFAFFGLVAVVGTAWLQAGRVEPLFVLAALPVGALVTAILVVNNLRDLDSDRAAGKRTLAVLFGPALTRAEYDALVAGACLVPALGALAGGRPLLLLPLAVSPLAARLVRAVHAGGDPRELNPVLRDTARLALGFSLLFGAGLALSR